MIDISGDGLTTGDEDPFDAFFDVGPVLMHSIDAEGRLVRVSRAWAELLGYSRAEMLGRRSTEFLTDTSRQRALDEVIPAFLKDGIMRDVPYDFVTKSGEEIPVLMSASGIYDADGNFKRSLAVIFDNRQAEQARIDLEDRANHLEEANLAKSRFLSAMSHEIRTPMNAIMGFAQLLKLSEMDDKRAGHVDSILSAGGSLMNLLTDLLDLGQVEEGKMKLDHRDFDLFAMLDQVADWWHSAAHEKGLNFGITIDQSLPRNVHSDPVRLQQVLNNFLGNAVKFTAQGNVQLSVRSIRRSTQVSRVRFQVVDTGPGIPQSQLENLFKPFVQLDADFGKDRGGWGLGLSICHNIAHVMSAQLGVVSTEGRGSTFSFELDLPHAADAQAVASDRIEAEAPKSIGDSLRVLLAEDNTLNQDMMRALLREMGHHVVTVANGFEVIESLHAEPFDVVIMDIMMPGLDGIATAKQIRASSTAVRDIPIIACSARATPETDSTRGGLGLMAFLPKPVDRRELQRLLSEVADTKGAGQKL